MTNGLLKLLRASKRHYSGSKSPDGTPAKRSARAAGLKRAGSAEEEACFGLPGQVADVEEAKPAPRSPEQPRCREPAAPLALEDESMHIRWAKVLAGRPATKLSAEELKELSDGGMPLKHRHELWPQWFAAPGIAGIEQLQAHVPEDVAQQIDADIARTQPQWMGPTEQRALRRVLRAYAARNPEVGYCQGMNNIAAVFILLGFDEVTALRGCYSMLNGCCPGYHSQDLAGFRLDALVLEELVKRVLPAESQQRLKALGVPLDVLVSEHFLTLGSRSWPLAATARLWDIVLQEGSPAVFASFLALLQLYLPSEAEMVSDAKFADDWEDAPEPVDVFRNRAMVGVAEDLETVLRKVREIMTKVPQNLIDQLRFDLAAKRR